MEPTCIKCRSQHCKYAGKNVCVMFCLDEYTPPPITNADRINAMTNEEKASFLALIELRFTSKRDITAELDKSYDKWLDWLKQEVDDG